MSVLPILKMGAPRLLRVAQPVTAFDTDALHWLVSDRLDTMRAASGAGLAAPQVGVDLQSRASMPGWCSTNATT